MPEETSTTTKKPINWKLIVIITVIAAIALGALAYVVVALDIFGTKTNETAATNTTTPEQSNPPKEGWSRHTSRNLGISVDYPKEFKVEELPTSVSDVDFYWLISILQPDTVHPEIRIESDFIYPDVKKAYERVSKYKINVPKENKGTIDSPGFTETRLPDVTVDGLTAIKLKSDSPDIGISGVTVYLKRGNNYFSFGLSTETKSLKSNAKIFDEILSSIKFIGTSIGEKLTSQWKSYSDETIGVSFKYPYTAKIEGSSNTKTFNFNSNPALGLGSQWILSVSKKPTDWKTSKDIESYYFKNNFVNPMEIFVEGSQGLEILEQNNLDPTNSQTIKILAVLLKDGQAYTFQLTRAGGGDVLDLYPFFKTILWTVKFLD
ncbi:MAG: hypothetical protein WD187_00580 [Candidatus Woykebacteria bacterium]